MTARILLSSLVLASTLGVAACASTSGPHPSYTEELDRLTDDCRERGGILSPIPGATTGRVQTDYACQINGGATRIPNRNN